MRTNGREITRSRRACGKVENALEAEGIQETGEAFSSFPQAIFLFASFSFRMCDGFLI